MSDLVGLLVVQWVVIGQCAMGRGLMDRSIGHDRYVELFTRQESLVPPLTLAQNMLSLIIVLP